MKQICFTFFLFWVAFNSFSQPFQKTDETIPFYALIGWGYTNPINNSTAWEINYDLNVVFPVIYKEKLMDLQLGIYIFDQQAGAFNRQDYGTGIHFDAGKRWDGGSFLAGIYGGPMVMFIDKNYRRKTELGFNFNIPLMYKPMEELGIGVNLFSGLSRHESVFGYAFCITLINVPKY